MTAPTTQAVILARGMGTRMKQGAEGAAGLTRKQQAAADSGAKGMMPFGRPFLDYLISALADAGIVTIVLVVAPGASVIREHFTQHPPQRVALKWAVQDEPRGTADAVLAARAAVGEEPFLVLNSDNYYPIEAYRSLAAVGGAGLVAFEARALIEESGIEVERVLRYALLDMDETDALTDVIEKPDHDHPLAQRSERWVSMNLWAFGPRIFEACERVIPSPRGELEIQDAVHIAMKELHERFQVIRMRSGVLDLSSRGDIRHVAAQLAAIAPTP